MPVPLFDRKTKMSETFTIKVRLEYDDKVAPWRTVPILHDLVRSLFLNGLNPSKLFLNS